MNTPTITATPEEARDKLREYKRRRLKDEEYQRIVEAYEWLAKGYKLIDVGDAIRDGGFDDNMRPRLAIARADRPTVKFVWWRHADGGRFDANAPTGRDYPQLVERINFNRTPDRNVEAYAVVPLLPPSVRPADALRNYHILWEVDSWSDRPIGARASYDPYLLKRVSGDLFAVIAEWDLTPLELAVCQGRALRR
jgi:hypothetical protein